MKLRNGLKRLVPAAGLVGLVACGGGSPQPPGSSPPPGGDTITVRGTERLGWDQPASDRGALASLQFAAYVDGTRATLTDVRCGDVQGSAGFVCSAPLPRLAPGTHVLELAAFYEDRNGIVESARSAPFRVTLLSASASVATSDLLIALGDGTRLMSQTVLTALDQPTAIAFAPPTRMFIAERTGRVLALDAGRVVAATVLTDVAFVGEGGLLDLTLHPDFDRNGYVYVVYTAMVDEAAFGYRVSRFREVRGVLGERAILLDEIAARAAESAAAIRFGPDRKLYVSLGSDRDGTASRASYAGKMLRLDEDGTTPVDNPGHSPVWSLGHASPQGFDWRPNGDLWAVERVPGHHDELNRIVASQDYADAEPGVQGAVPPVLALSSTLGVSGAAFYRGTAIGSFRGDLLVAASNGRDVLRVRFDPDDPQRVALTEPLLAGRLGRIGGVDVGPDGAVYVFTANRGRLGASSEDDRLVRLVPASVRQVQAQP